MFTTNDSADPIRVGFVCVENAGRSQIAAAVAETQLHVQSRTDVDVISGGTNPAEEIYSVVADVMAEKGYDLSNQSPQKITRETLRECDIVALMGCSLSAPDLPTGVVIRDWGFIDPADGDPETVWAISTEVEQRVIELIDDLPTQSEREDLTTAYSP
jgi:arsenate reductase